MNILVTGCAGFIGSHLVERLLMKNDCYVVGLDNLSNGSFDNMKTFIQHPNFYFVNTDLRYSPQVKIEKAIDKLGPINFVYHLAALGSVPRSIGNPTDTFENNVKVTHDLLHWSVKHQVQKFIFASSSSVYGNNNRFPKNENDPCLPANPYGLSKLVGEQYCKVFSHTYGLDATCLRFFNVFGPRQRWKDEFSAVVPTCIEKMLSGEELVLHNNGTQTRDFTYVGEVVEVMRRCLFMSTRDVYNVACGVEVKLVDFIQDLFNAVGVRANTRLEFEPRQGDILRSKADVTRLQHDFNYSPVRTRKQLIETYSYYRKLFKNDNKASIEFTV